MLSGLHYKERLGTKARRQARTSIQRFQDFCWDNEVLLLDEASNQEAAKIYAYQRRTGKAFQEHMDFLIAGIALSKGFSLVTDNTKHFATIEGLNLESW